MLYSSSTTQALLLKLNTGGAAEQICMCPTRYSTALKLSSLDVQSWDTSAVQRWTALVLAERLLSRA